MQRYIPSVVGRFWYMAASPVSTGTVAMWQTGAPTLGFYVTGAFTGASNPGNGITSTATNMYNWDAVNGAWNPYPTTTNAALVAPKTGYCIFLRDGNATYNGGVTAAKTFSLLGPPTTGTQVFSLSYNVNGGTGGMLGGWNLIGNPYASNITGNLSNAAWSNSGNMDGLATYIWDSDAASYVSCNGGVGSCTIPSSQAFWVRVNPGGGTITATENVKVTGSIPFYRTAAPTYIPVVLTNTQTTKKDVTYLRFEDDATLNFDNQYDAYKLMFVTSSATVALSTVLSSTVNLSINARPIPLEKDTVALKIVGATGAYTLDFTDKTNLDAEYTMFLLDKYNQSVTDVSQQAVYSFDLTSGDSTTFKNRFYIVFGYVQKVDVVTGTQDQSLSQEVNIYPNPCKSGDAINVNVGENSKKLGASFKVAITSIKGQEEFSEVMSSKSISNNVITVNPSKKLAAGIYYVNITADGVSYTQKLFVY